jgi:hypothetical protein
LTPLLNARQKYSLWAVVYGFFRLALAFFSIVEISLHSLGFQVPLSEHLDGDGCRL